MARGKPFPTCIGANNINISTRRGAYTFWRDSVVSREKAICADGETPPYSRRHYYDEGVLYTCKYIDIRVPLDIASDEEHQKQRYFYTR